MVLLIRDQHILVYGALHAPFSSIYIHKIRSGLRTRPHRHVGTGPIYTEDPYTLAVSYANHVLKGVSGNDRDEQE